jgi:hypothetical protein
MSHRYRIIVSVLAVAMLGSAGAAAQKKVYCWNQNGKKVCGDALPAEAANSARTEISTKSGLRTGQVARALTDAERTAAALAAETARRQADADAVLQRRDLAMVESYLTEADLRRAYGERTELLDETLKASTLGLSNLRLSLLGLLRQAGDKELAGDPVPKPLADSIRNQHAELLRQQQLRVIQQQNRAALETELNAALTRYRALKQPAATDTPPTAATPPSG